MDFFKLSKSKFFIIAILLIVFFVLLNLTNFSKNINNFLYLASAPIQRVLWEVGDNVSDFFKTTFDIRELQEANKNFKLKVQELSAEVARLKNLRQENEALRKALNLDIQKEFEIAFASIISKDISEDSILINLGVADGIKKDMLVISPQKILLGRVNQVYDNFSRVMLVSNKKNSFPINIQKTTNNIIKEGNEIAKEYNNNLISKKEDVEAIIQGKGNFQIKINYIPIEAEIKDGDRVVTSISGGLFPSGILIGYLKNIERLGIEMFQQAEIIPAANIKELHNVFIITNF
jgi:rod shape-determining protein MreC